MADKSDNGIIDILVVFRTSWRLSSGPRQVGIIIAILVVFRTSSWLFFF